MEEMRIAIIGTGMISNRHMTIWGHIPGAKVVAAAEIDEAKLRAWGQRYGFEEKDLYTDFREMLKRDDIDAVDVCVHNNLHTPVSVAVMRAGYPCYCEKPMAASYADAKILYDAQKVYGQKLAVQISSIFTQQTVYAKKLIEDGKLGKLYHARSVGHRREGRPGFDMTAFSRDFISAKIGVHGPLCDLGIYHIAQVLYLMGMPELNTVFGVSSADYYQDPRLQSPEHPYEVEDLSVGIATFRNGISLDVYEDWAMHVDEVGPSFIAGSMGGVKLINVDSSGGPKAVPDNSPRPYRYPQLEWYGYEDGIMTEKKINCQMNEWRESSVNPGGAVYLDNQVHWLAYLRGELTDETRIDTPYIAMQTALLSDGIFLSQALNRSVTADEIKEQSKSIALHEQETPWGVIHYDF